MPTFREMKSVFETRPVFHQRDETICGHFFCSFLALVMRKELYRRFQSACHSRFEWQVIEQDLKALQEITIEKNDKKLAVRRQCLGTCGEMFQALGVAPSPPSGNCKISWRQGAGSAKAELPTRNMLF